MQTPWVANPATPGSCQESVHGSYETIWKREQVERYHQGRCDMQGIYLPILLIILSGLLIGLSMIALNLLFAPRRPDPEKELPYECGFDALEDARSPFSIRYYLVAILFILFDLELIFLLPWAVALPEIGTAGFLAMLLFLGLLGLGLVYEWRRKALEWD